MRKFSCEDQMRKQEEEGNTRKKITKKKHRVGIRRWEKEI